MPKLNQIIAVANGRKSRVQSGVTELYHQLQKSVLLDGISRHYQPKDEDGETLPPEQKRVQLRVGEALNSAASLWTDMFNVVGTLDAANTKAKADVVVDGTTVVADVPVTHLLFLEKQLQDVHSFVSKLPTLDPAFEWEWSHEADCYATKPSQTTRTKKIPRNHVKYEATKEHPAQVEMFTEDVVVGYWTKTDFSGAIPESERNAILDRIRKLQDAVKSAREEANGIEVQDVNTGKPVFAYLFGNTAG